jgi:hypothetical protein
MATDVSVHNAYSATPFRLTERESQEIPSEVGGDCFPAEAKQSSADVSDGTTSAEPIEPKPRDIQRFWKYVDRRSLDECWPWTASRRNRYGQLALYRDGRLRVVGAHRFSWVLANGEVPDGLHVCHVCDNPPCVNPNHLFLGTNQDNRSDACAKGRSHCVRLTDEQIADVRSLHKAGVPRARIAKQLGLKSHWIEPFTKREHGPNLGAVCSRRYVSKATKYRSYVPTSAAALDLQQKATTAIFELASLKGFLPNDLATRVGTSHQRIDQLLRGGIKTLAVLAVMADALGCDVDISLTQRAIAKAEATRHD